MENVAQSELTPRVVSDNNLRFSLQWISGNTFSCIAPTYVPTNMTNYFK